jgi:uncharacterized protein YndB with AHSA1/START domain
MAAEPVTATVHIDAPPERVYEYFTRPEAVVRWMGEYALLEPEPGGRFTLDVTGAPVRGRFLHLDPPHRLVISWGYAGSDRLPPVPARWKCGSPPKAPVPGSTSNIATCRPPSSPGTPPAGPTTWPGSESPPWVIPGPIRHG